MSDAIEKFNVAVENLIDDLVGEDSQELIAEKRKSEKFRDLYLDAIENTCKHQRFNLARGASKVELTCSCCKKIVAEYKSFEEAHKHIDPSQLVRLPLRVTTSI